MNIVPVAMNRDEHRKYETLKRDLVLRLDGGEIDAVNAASLSGKLCQLANGAIYNEGKLAFMNVKSTLYTWAAFQPNRIPADFKDRSGEDVWKEISVSYPSILFRLFERALNGEPQEEIRLDAFESVPGLTQIWTQPFHLKFQVADGMLVLRFKKHESGNNEITADLVK